MATVRIATPARHALAATAALAVAGSLFATPPAALAATSSAALAPTPPTVVTAAATTASDHPLLRQGSTGAAVRQWQTVVSSVLGRNGVAVDGVFGPKTTAATRTVQKKFGLAADGIVGRRTWGATKVVHTPVDPTRIDGPVASVGHLERGDRGAKVAHWQRLLDTDPRSTFATVADGVFGRATLASTKAFQRRYGLAPDGVVGPNTRAAMQKVRDDV